MTSGTSNQDSAGSALHNLPYPPLGDLFTGRQANLRCEGRTWSFS